MPDRINLKTDVLDKAVDTTMRDLRVALPATALDYSRGASRVTLQPRVRVRGMDLTPRDEPNIPDAPVLHYAGGGYGCWFDLRAEDPAVVLACDGPVRSFYETGDTVTPQHGQGHDYGCAVAFPGGRVSASSNPTDPPNAAGECLVGAADGSAAVIFRGAGLSSPVEAGTVVVNADKPTASILLGSANAASPVACADEVQANLEALNAAIQAWVPVPQDGGASLKIIFQAWANTLIAMADRKARVDGPTL